MLLHATLLITLSILGEPQSPIVSDQLQFRDCQVVTVYSKLNERIGSKIRLSGINSSVSVPDDVELPRIDESSSNDCLSLTLLKRENQWEVVQFNGFVPFNVILEEQIAVITQNLTTDNFDNRRAIERFLLRESSADQRWNLWLTFRSSAAQNETTWMALGGEFFSGSIQLSEFIRAQSLEPLAMQASLHPLGDLWISTSDLARHQELVGGPNGYVSSVRVKLLDQANAQLPEILKKSRLKRPNKGVKFGSLRKSVRKAWGDPQSVTWVRLDHHLLEHWQYAGRYLRMIDGRVYELEKSNEVSLSR